MCDENLPARENRSLVIERNKTLEFGWRDKCALEMFCESEHQKNRLLNAPKTQHEMTQMAYSKNEQIFSQIPHSKL